jgi:predicted esterase YcpF (UPF0227 family)
MLIYLHGLNSAPASHKAQLLCREMATRGQAAYWRCPALPPEPLLAITTIEAEIRAATEQCETITLVGSSLGGFYATHLAEKHDLRAVLLNPAVQPQQDLEVYIGPQRNLYTGATYELTAEHIAQWRALDVPRVHPERYLLIVETGDEVLDYRAAVRKYAGSRQIIVPGGDHSLRSFPRHIDEILGFAGLAHV